MWTFQVVARRPGMYRAEADNVCHASSAQLASIHSKEENDLVLSSLHIRHSRNENTDFDTLRFNIEGAPPTLSQ